MFLLHTLLLHVGGAVIAHGSVELSLYFFFTGVAERRLDLIYYPVESTYQNKNDRLQAETLLTGHLKIAALCIESLLSRMQQRAAGVDHSDHVFSD